MGVEPTETTKTADTPEYRGSNTAISVAISVEDTDLFTKIFNEMYD